ncbi:hypothetical protein V9L05_03170 [Bernardetia sp. Wsw4-3y2]|uniref:hypothetical protein n=1 Tax=Bernardetia sp. Wsw4-3y2 TaxID=3127471 RepID=UPI0030D5B42D
MQNIDIAKLRFEEFKLEFEKFEKIDLSETDTRSKILDYLLIKVLGWEEENIDREKYVQEGYYDYLISVPSFSFVLEAKKNFVEIHLPTNHKKASINSLLKGNQKVIEQIRKYLFEVGVQYGVISNGRQFIIGQFVNSDGSDWKKNSCIIFNGIEDIDKRFIEFFNALSKVSVIENGRIYSTEIKEEFRKSIYSSLPVKNAEIVRNSLSSELTPILNQVFNEIYKHEVLDNEELIKECFVENKEIKKNKSDIEKLFGDRPPNLSEVSGARNTQSIIEQISDEFKNYPIGTRDIEPPKPILIIGSKGAGKTTFINYLFKSGIENEILNKRPYVYLDFRKYVDEDLKIISEKIYKDIISNIHERYESLKLYSRKVLERIYLSEIKEYKEIWTSPVDENEYDKYLREFLNERTKDYESHFNKISLYFLKERYMRLTIIIDNADQFNLDIQKKVFLFAQSINRKAKCAVMLSLREGYYYEWRNKPPFDAFVNNVYHITAPPYAEVLQKRIDYAIKNVNMVGESTGSLGMSTFKIDNDAILDFFQGLKNSIFGNENSEMLRFLEETTYPNLRDGLNVFRDFLLSGHTEVSEYIIRQRMSDEEHPESIPFWEFLKAIALLNRKYYNHSESTIHNLFYPAEGSDFVFFKIKLLMFLLDRIEQYNQTEKFIQASEIIDSFMQQGFKRSVILSEINELYEYRLIETNENASDREFNNKMESQESISISLKGRYYIDDLINRYVYIELCLQDTPIFYKEYYSKIKDIFPMANDKGKRNIIKRYETVEFFLDYLKHREKEELGSDEVVSKLMNKGLEEDLYKMRMTVSKHKATKYKAK